MAQEYSPLLVRPDLVSLESAPAELEDEVRRAAAEAGEEHLERFVSAIVCAVKEEGHWHE